MSKLFTEFPFLEDEKIIIKKMAEEDVDALSEISHSDEVYKYIPPFLYKKSKAMLLTAIKNLGGRDFDKQKLIIAGIYLKDTNRLVGLAEMFDYKKRANQITVGYRINEKFWNQKITTCALRLMKDYLLRQDISKILAYVIPQNVYSARALQTNGFEKQNYTEQKQNWGGKDFVTLDVYMLHKIP